MTHAMGWVTTFSYPTGSNACEYALDETTLLDVATLVHSVCNHVVLKYLGFMTFRTAHTIVSYTRHSTKPTTTTRHGHVVNYAVSLCAHAHQNTQIPCAPLVFIAEEKGKHVKNMFMPQMSDRVLLLHVKTGPLSERAKCMRLRASHLLLYNPHLHSTRSYMLAHIGSPFYAFSVRALTKCAPQKRHRKAYDPFHHNPRSPNNRGSESVALSGSPSVAPRCCLSLSVRGLTSHENINRRETSRLNFETATANLIKNVDPSKTPSRSLPFYSQRMQSSRCRVVEKAFVMVSRFPSCLPCAARLEAGNRKHISAWTRRCPSLADEPQPLRGAEHFLSELPLQRTGTKRHASQMLLKRSVALATRRHSMASALAELVLSGPCRRHANSVKKELLLDPEGLILHPPKHRVPNDAPQKLLSHKSPQSSPALFITRDHSAGRATNPEFI